MAGWSFKKRPRRPLRRLLALSALVLGVALFVALQGEGSAATLQNPDFERDSGGVPAGWFISEAARAKGEAVVVEEQSRRLRLSPTERNAPGPDPLGIGQLIEAEPLHGKQLRVSARIGAEGGATAVVGAVLLDASGDVLTQLVLRQSSDDGNLVDHSDETASPVSEEAQSLIVFASVEGTAGHAWFDRVQIDAFADGPDTRASTEAPETFAATLSLQPGSRLRTIPRTLFGTNVEWIREGNGLWDTSAGALNETMVSLSRDAGVTLVRFPGGVWSDTYHWQDGVGPQETRATTPHYPGDDERSRHYLGTDEIAEFARRISAQLLITVNAGSGTAREAGKWAAHVRDTHGSDLVYLWQIGNELYMAEDLSGGSMSPEAYAEKVLEFAEAIRAEIPDARIGAIGLKNYGRYRFNDYPDWNETVLQRAGEVIDYFTVHNAYAPLTPDLTASEGERGYRAMLAAPVLIAENLRDTATMIDELSGDNADRIEIAVTEWGPWFTFDPASPFFDHVKTLGSAVYAARVFNVFLRDPRTQAANAFKLSDWLKMGWIGLTDDDDWRATPALSVLQLYSRGLGDHLIEIEVDGPTFSVPATGFVSAVRDAPVVDAVATKDADGRIVIIASSADLWADATVTVELGVEGRYRLTPTLLTGPAPDAHRATRMIEVPGLDFAAPASLGPRGAMETSTEDSVPLIDLDPREVGSTFEVDLPAISVLRLVLEPLP